MPRKLTGTNGPSATRRVGAKVAFRAIKLGANTVAPIIGGLVVKAAEKRLMGWLGGGAIGGYAGSAAASQKPVVIVVAGVVLDVIV
jgi:hypothetical protein